VEQLSARILFHPFHFIPESWNGIDEHLRLLAKYLDRERFDLQVLEHATDGSQTRTLADRAGLRLLAAPFVPGAPAMVRFRALRQLHRSEGIDIVHLHSPAAGGVAVPALAARLAGCRVIATYHQVQPWRAPPRTRLINRAVHSFAIDATVAVSSGVRTTLAARTGVPASRVRVLHNGIDTSEPIGPSVGVPPHGPGEVRLAYCGRLSPEKGLRTLLQALPAVAERCPHARTWIVGEGPDRPELETLAGTLGVTDRVQFLGFRPDARALMAAADIVVHVPEYEGFGIVVLEAMAAGRPVVVSDGPGGLSDIVVPGETGLIVPAGDSESLAKALGRLAGEPAERERLGRNGRERCEREFSARVMAERTAALYERVLSRLGRERLSRDLSLK
jgi:glycosyltransferase involved in cell wall biosynthesis